MNVPTRSGWTLFPLPLFPEWFIQFLWAVVGYDLGSQRPHECKHAGIY